MANNYITLDAAWIPIRLWRTQQGIKQAWASKLANRGRIKLPDGSLGVKRDVMGRLLVREDAFYPKGTKGGRQEGSGRKRRSTLPKYRNS